jgi:glycosyltransferase involved in cell wall biosynthesis
MRVGVNAQILSDHDAGVATYVRNLLIRLARLATNHELHIFGNPRYIQPGLPVSARVVPTHGLIRGRFRRILWEQLLLPRTIQSLKLDRMFYPDYAVPLVGHSCRTVITVHDLSYIAMPEFFTRGRSRFKSFVTGKSVQRADTIIAVSQATKRECERLLGVPPEKVKVVYNGIDAVFRPVVNPVRRQEVKQKYGLQDRFIVFVGTLEPRKNLPRLLEAYALLLRQSKVPHNLVVAGGKGWMFDSVFAAVTSHGLSDHVQFLGYVPQTDLVAVYGLASALVYPSLYEGFGFPPLEAMACGTPAIVSNQSSLPEITGDAAELVDPNDPADIARGMLRVLDDPLRAEELRLRGFARVKQFSWDRSAAEILKIITSP